MLHNQQNNKEQANYKILKPQVLLPVGKSSLIMK